MLTGRINTTNGDWTFNKYGYGSVLLIALHGHGDRADTFNVLQSALKKDYIVYALDLPFHGHTTWRRDFFDVADFQEVIQHICEAEKKDSFVGLGFSFGARVWQRLLPIYQQQLEALIFVAPDGFRSQGMRTLGLVPYWFRDFLKKRLQSPERFVRILHFLRKNKIITQFRFDYLMMNTANKRRVERSFGMWTSLEFFPKNLKSFEANLLDWDGPIKIYLGKYDKIVFEKTILEFAKNIPKMDVFFVEGGHRLVGEELAKVLGSQDTKNLSIKRLD